MTNNVRLCSCISCKEVFASRSIPLHYKRCAVKGGKYIRPVFNSLTCLFCDKVFESANALSQHKVRCPNNTNRIDVSNIFNNSDRNKIPWNKGKTKETDDTIATISAKIKQLYDAGHYDYRKGVPLTDEHKSKMSESIVKNASHNGGYKRVPYIKYICLSGKEITLRGSYEARFASLLDRHNIEWEYEKSIPYMDGNIFRHCFPDFFLTEVRSLHRH